MLSRVLLMPERSRRNSGEALSLISAGLDGAASSGQRPEIADARARSVSSGNFARYRERLCRELTASASAATSSSSLEPVRSRVFQTRAIRRDRASRRSPIAFAQPSQCFSNRGEFALHVSAKPPNARASTAATRRARCLASQKLAKPAKLQKLFR